MGNILFFVQNTVSVDGQNSSSKFTVRVKVRADLQAAATEQTLSRSIPLAVWNASPSSHSFVRFSASKITERSTTRSFTSGNLLKGSRVTTLPLQSRRKTEQARRGRPLIRMAQAPHLRIMQPHSHAMGETTVPLFSHRGLR